MAFAPGAKVWAKTGKSPWWPAQVVKPSPRLPAKPNKTLVYFFQSHNHGYIAAGQLRDFEANLAEITASMAKKPNKNIENAIAELRDPAQDPVKLEAEAEAREMAYLVALHEEQAEKGLTEESGPEDFADRKFKKKSQKATSARKRKRSKTFEDELEEEQEEAQAAAKCEAPKRKRAADGAGADGHPPAKRKPQLPAEGATEEFAPESESAMENIEIELADEEDEDAAKSEEDEEYKPTKASAAPKLQAKKPMPDKKKKRAIADSEEDSEEEDKGKVLAHPSRPSTIVQPELSAEEEKRKEEKRLRKEREKEEKKQRRLEEKRQAKRMRLEKDKLTAETLSEQVMGLNRKLRTSLAVDQPDITSALECLQTLASVQLTAKIFTENIGVLTECIDTIKKSRKYQNDSVAVKAKEVYDKWKKSVTAS